MIIIIQIIKWVNSEGKYFNRKRPIGDPIIIPINIFVINFQSILFLIYGIINILINTSSIKIIGTISIAGRIKENPEIQVAEKPNPLKPLITEATKTVNIIKYISNKLNCKNDKKSKLFFFF